LKLKKNLKNNKHPASAALDSKKTVENLKAFKRINAGAKAVNSNSSRREIIIALKKYICGNPAANLIFLLAVNL